MQAKSTIQFKFDPNKEYKCPKDKIDALVEFITKHVHECPAHWIIMSPDLVAVLHMWNVFSPSPVISNANKKGNEFIFQPTHSRVTLNHYACQGEMNAVVFPDYSDSLYILNCGHPKDFIGDMRPELVWDNLKKLKMEKRII
jgi:hypothetical protein